MRRSFFVLGGMALASTALLAVVALFSVSESRYECSGYLSDQAGKSPATAFVKLDEYRWWVSFWNDSFGGLWIEVPNRTYDYFGDLRGSGEIIYLEKQNEFRGSFSKLSKTLAVKTSLGFYDGVCKRVRE